MKSKNALVFTLAAPPGTGGLAASLQIIPVGTSAGPTIIRYVPLQPPGPPVCQ
jgi:hypothetical protein